MNLPVQVTFHNLPHSDEIEDKILVEAERLEHFYDRITSCRVVIDVPHAHQKTGRLYQIRIDLNVPGEELVARRESTGRQEFRDIDVAIRDAFDEARRQLEDYVRRLRGDVKSHQPASHARVTRLCGEAGYGFLETPEGREVYFHKNSVSNGEFKRLEVGTEVSYAEEMGDKGPQATVVRAAGRHGGLA
jgi:cold shock CspA family protein